jgi:hypothetical protein
MAEADPPQRDPGQHHGDEQQGRGDQFRRASARGHGRRAWKPAVRQENVHGRLPPASPVSVVSEMIAARIAPSRGEKDDGLIQRVQPFIRLMSSTAMEPRLR